MVTGDLESVCPPTNDLITPDGIGRYTYFAANGSIYWTPNTGAWSVHGAIRDHWAALGWETRWAIRPATMGGFHCHPEAVVPSENRLGA